MPANHLRSMSLDSIVHAINGHTSAPVATLSLDARLTPKQLEVRRRDGRRVKRQLKEARLKMSTTCLRRSTGERAGNRLVCVHGRSKAVGYP